MKKIVIAMLLILPLIIVLTVLVATTIISNEAYIAVERVELNVNNKETMELYLSQKELQLQATVYPTSAKNREVKWKLENIQCFGDEIENPVTISKSGLLKYSTYCTFDVVVTTKEGNKKARCNFYVKCDTVDGVSLNVEKENLRVGESVKIKTVFNPVDAEVAKAVWTSDNANVLTVDNNGIITAKNIGTAKISVIIDDKVSAEKTFTVTKGVTKFGTAFATARADFDISDLDADGDVSVISGGTILGNAISFTANVMTLDVDGIVVTVVRCEENDITFENLNMVSELSLAVGKLPVCLSAVFRDAFVTEKPSVSYETSDDKVATVDNNGTVVAIGKGDVRITAKYGDHSIYLDYFAIKPVNYIRLNTVDGDDKKGIAEETVFGTKSVKNGVLSDFTLPISIQYPKDADWDDFTLSVDKTDIARIEGKNVVVFGNVEENTVLTVSVTAKYSAYESTSVRANRKLTIKNGVNCYSYADMQKASAEGIAIMQQSDIEVAKQDGTINLYDDFYGNGFLLDASTMIKSSDTAILKICSDGIKVSNANVRSDDVVKINEANGLSGYILVVGEINQPTRYNDITVEYCIFENGYYCMDIHNSDIYVNGCILRNTSNFGICLSTNMRSDGECDYSNLTMNNCVMSNIVATAIGVAANAKIGKNTPLPQQSNLYSKGFLDIYNWQDVTSMRMLDRDLVPGNDAANTMLKNLAGTALKNEISKDKYSNIRMDKDNIKYLHLGIVTAGALYPSTSIVEIEDERFIKLPLDVLKTFGLEQCVLYLYENTSDIQPDSAFAEDEELYIRLRGEQE